SGSEILTNVSPSLFYNNPELKTPYLAKSKMFHIAFSRLNNIERFFINGKHLLTTAGGITEMSNTLGNHTHPLIIGNYSENNNYTTPSGYNSFGGRIKRLRIYQECLYTKNFIPSTKPYNVEEDGDWVFDEI